MKRSPLAVLLVVSISFSSALAQVGIGTESPNQKAVLELKSPGNNQGFLVPRLTTAQRTGMAGLSASEKGLLVFDSDINKFYYWSGSVWIIIDDSTGTDSQTLSFNPTTGLLSITGGNGINLGGVTPGGSAGGDLTGTYPNPTVAANVVTSAKISDGTIVTNDLADGSVTTAKIVDGTITNADINASAAIAITKVAPGTNGQVLVTSGTTPTWMNMPPPSGTAGGDLSGTYPNPTIANNAIISIKILDGAIITSKIADAAINTLKLLDGAITSAKILDATIATADILDGAISTLKIADNGVTSLKILDGSITSAKVLDGTLATVDVADGAITSVKVLDGAITSAKVFDGTLATADLADGSITSVKVLDGAITSAKILDGTVATGDILDGTVGTNDIGNTAITNGKIADNAINSIKIADGTVATVDLLDGAITDVKIASGIDVSKLSSAPTDGFFLTTVLGDVTWAAFPVLGLGTVTTVNTGAGLTGGPILTSGTISLADNGVTTTKVLNDAITSAKLQDDATTDANRAVTTNHIRDNAIVSSKINDGTIVNTDINTAAAVAVSKLAAGATGDVLTTLASGVPTWQAPVDNTLSEVLTAGNNAGAQAAINYSAVSIGRADTPGALNVTGSHYRSFTLLGSVTTYTVAPADNVIIGTNVGSVTTVVTLPAGTASIGRVLTLRGRSIGSASIAGMRFQASGTETIDGVTLAPYYLTPSNGNFISVTVLKISASEWITIARSPF